MLLRTGGLYGFVIGGRKSRFQVSDDGPAYELPAGSLPAGGHPFGIFLKVGIHGMFKPSDMLPVHASDLICRPAIG